MITFDDRVFGFGSNSGGVLGLGHKNSVNEVTEIHKLKGNNIKEFYNGLVFVIAMIGVRNELFGWGVNYQSQLGRGYKSEYNKCFKPEKVKSIDNKVIKEISCGYYHTIVLTNDGLLYGWGWNVYGQIGFNYIDYILKPKEIAFFSKIKIKSVFCTSKQSFVLTIDGLVYSFGYNSGYCLGHELLSKNTGVFIPKLIESLNNIKTIGFSRNNYNYYYLNKFFLTNDRFLYFCGKLNENIFEKKPKLMKTKKFNDFIQKNKTIVIKENSNEIFELKSNSIIKSEFNNIFDFYANIKQ